MTSRTWSIISWVWVIYSPVGILLFYFISIRFDPWWSSMDASGQAAWVQTIRAIIVFSVVVLIPYFQRWSDQKSKKSKDRKIVMSAATNLAIALDYASTHFAFAPAGDGVIGHDFILEQAREFMKFETGTREALQKAIDKAHFFDEMLCEKNVLLSIIAVAYERLIDELARHTPGSNVDQFFKMPKARRRRCLFELMK
jgi:hypothetical protein